MKKFTQIAFTAMVLLAGAFSTKAQNVGVGTVTPDVSARLDINATNKGLLIPQVNLTSLTDATTIATPAKGLLVFNTNTTLGTGFYYNNGTTAAASWLRLSTSAASGSGWGLTGNAGTDSTLNFLGTINAKPLTFRVNNGYAGMLSPYGAIALGRGAGGTQKSPLPSVMAIGDSALFASTADSSVIAIGNGALFNSDFVGQSDNVAIGNISMVTNTIGFNNVAVGDFTLSSSDTGFNNVAVGFGASFNTLGEENTAVGSLALSNDIIGFANTAVGFESLTSNTNGFYNVSVGHVALLNNGTGNRNTAIGRASLPADTSGLRNTALGYFSGVSISNGSRNIAIGAYSMRTNATGSNNICIGDSANTSTAALSNAIAIGNGAIVNASNKVVVGNVLATSIGGQVGWSTFSDGRYKKDVEENVSGLNFIMKLRPVTYHYDFDKINNQLYATENTVSNLGTSRNPFAHRAFGKGKMGTGLNVKRANLSITDDSKGRVSGSEAVLGANPNEGVRFTGFIAQEVEAAAKTAGFDFSGVDKPATSTGNYALRYAEFVVPLVKAVQEQQAVIDAQNKKIEELTKRLEKLENK